VARLIRPDIDPYDGFAPQPGEVDVVRLHDVPPLSPLHGARLP